MPPSHFFEGIDSPAAGPSGSISNGTARRDEFITLNEAFSSIHDSETRASVLALVRSLATRRRGAARVQALKTHPR